MPPGWTGTVYSGLPQHLAVLGQALVISRELGDRSLESKAVADRWIAPKGSRLGGMNSSDAEAVVGIATATAPQAETGRLARSQILQVLSPT